MAIVVGMAGSTCLVLAGPSEEFALSISKRVSASKYATLIAVRDKKTKPKVVEIRDLDWIKKFSFALRTGKYEPELHVFAVSPDLSFFDSDGMQLISFELLPENTLRVDSDDFEVDETTFVKVRDLLKAKVK
jgi:hypothetical protein